MRLLSTAVSFSLLATLLDWSLAVPLPNGGGTHPLPKHIHKTFEKSTVAINKAASHKFNQLDPTLDRLQRGDGPLAFSDQGYMKSTSTLQKSRLHNALKDSHAQVVKHIQELAEINKDPAHMDKALQYRQDLETTMSWTGKNAATHAPHEKIKNFSIDNRIKPGQSETAAQGYKEQHLEAQKLMNRHQPKPKAEGSSWMKSLGWAT